MLLKKCMLFLSINVLWLHYSLMYIASKNIYCKYTSKRHQSNIFCHVLIWCNVHIFQSIFHYLYNKPPNKSKLLPFVTFRACVFMFYLSIHRSLQLGKYSVYNSLCLQQTFLINCDRNTVISSLIAALQIKSQHDTETMVTTFSRQIKEKEILSRKVAKAKL